MMLSIRICTIAAITSVALADKHAATTAAGGTTAGVKSPSLVTDDGHLILKTGKGKDISFTSGSTTLCVTRLYCKVGHLSASSAQGSVRQHGAPAHACVFALSLAVLPSGVVSRGPGAAANGSAQ